MEFSRATAFLPPPNPRPFYRAISTLLGDAEGLRESRRRPSPSAKGLEKLVPRPPTECNSQTSPNDYFSSQLEISYRDGSVFDTTRNVFV